MKFSRSYELAGSRISTLTASTNSQHWLTTLRFKTQVHLCTQAINLRPPAEPDTV